MNLYASDLRLDFCDIGYDLFADRATLQAQFIGANIFDEPSSLITTLSDKVNIVNAASFFHLFDWNQQVIVAKRIVRLLRAQPGSLLIGRQVGRIDPLDPMDEAVAGSHYQHDPSTWKRLWEQVGGETGTKWEVEAWMEEWTGADKVMRSYHGELQTFKLRFAVRRL